MFYAQLQKNKTPLYLWQSENCKKKKEKKKAGMLLYMHTH